MSSLYYTYFWASSQMSLRKDTFSHLNKLQPLTLRVTSNQVWLDLTQKGQELSWSTRWRVEYADLGVRELFQLHSSPQAEIFLLPSQNSWTAVVCFQISTIVSLLKLLKLPFLTQTSKLQLPASQFWASQVWNRRKGRRKNSVFLSRHKCM